MNNKVPAGWGAIKLEDTSEILDSKRIPLNSDERYNMKGNIPYYGANGVVDFINDYIFEEDLILMAEDGGNFDDYQNRPIAYRITGKSWVNNHAHVLRVKQGYDFNYIFYSLEHKNLIPVIKGGTRSKLNQAELRVIPVLIPNSISEQKKIASTLNSIDKTLGKTRALIEKIKKIKQGLMHDFFELKINIAKGQGIINVELGNKEFFELATGGTPSTSIPEYWGGEIKWMSSGEVHKKRIFQVDGRITQIGYENSNARIIPVDSVLIALAGQGKTRGTVAINKVELTMNQSVAAIIPNINKIYPEYLYHYLDNKYQELRSISAGAGRAGLSLTILSKYEILISESIDRQKKIAKVLDTTDFKIQSEESYLNKLIKIKAGLIQDLLTGKVRVLV
jgi:type I restriction enzyme S subunit